MAIQSLPSCQPLCWTREGGQGMTEMVGHDSDPGCKMQHDLSHFNVTERADAGPAVLPPDRVLSGGFRHICRARL